MKNYAVVDNNIVINTIVADSKEIAEEVTGKQCIEYQDENPMGIGWSWSNVYNKYISPSPFPSWVYNGSYWEAPITMPIEEGKAFGWNEETMSWDSFDLPQV
jgi:hypothetical protein